MTFEEVSHGTHALKTNPQQQSLWSPPHALTWVAYCTDPLNFLGFNAISNKLPTLMKATVGKNINKKKA